MKSPDILAIVRRDRRYPYEAYEFVFEALRHTQWMCGRLPREGERPGREHHVAGPEIARGAVDLARREFGFMARTVFRQWGVRTTDDLGELVFNLIEAGLLSKTDSDHRSDFHDLFDLEAALLDGFAIELSDQAGNSLRSER